MNWRGVVIVTVATIAAGTVAIMAAGVATQAGAVAPGQTSSSADPAAAAELRAQGMQFGYNLDHAEALDAFKSAIAADPSHPAAYRLAAAALWAQLLFDQGAITVDDYLGQARDNPPKWKPNAALVASFQDLLLRAIAISEQRLREHPNDADAHYQVGAALGLQASYIATIEGRVMGSFSAARRAYKEHEQALELDPSRKDAGLMVGLYSNVVADMSTPVRVFAQLMGLGGDRDKGLRLVEDAARFLGDGQTDARLTLILLYSRQARYDDAGKVVATLLPKYPRNRLLWIEAGNAALRAGHPAQARAALEEGISRLRDDPRPRARGEDSRWHYAYGTTLVALKDVERAESELQAALQSATRDWLRGRAHNEIGKINDLRNDRPHALDEYRLADRLCRQDHDDECSNDARALIKLRYR